MVQKNAALQGDHRGDMFADDDPLAELARIVGFEPPAAERDDVAAAPHSDARDSHVEDAGAEEAGTQDSGAQVSAGYGEAMPATPARSQDELDLEAELMREFETYRSPAVVAPTVMSPAPVEAELPVQQPVEQPAIAPEELEFEAVDYAPQAADAADEPVFDEPETAAETSHPVFEPDYEDDHTASGGDPADELAAAFSLDQPQYIGPEFPEPVIQIAIEPEAFRAPQYSDDVQFVEAPEDHAGQEADQGEAGYAEAFAAGPVEPEPAENVPDMPILDLSSLDMSDWQRGETTDIAPHLAEIAQHEETAPAGPDYSEDTAAFATDAAEPVETIPFEDYASVEDVVAQDAMAAEPWAPVQPADAYTVPEPETQQADEPAPFFEMPQHQTGSPATFEPVTDDLTDDFTDDLVGELELAVADVETDEVVPLRNLTRPAPGANRPGLPLTNFAFSRTTPVMGRLGAAQPLSSPISAAPAIAPAPIAASAPQRPADEFSWPASEDGGDAALMAEAELDMGDLSALDGFGTSPDMSPERFAVEDARAAEPVPSIAEPAPSIAQQDFDFSSAFEAQLAENEDFVERENASAATRHNEAALSEDAFDPFADGEFDFDLDELELDLSEFIDDAVPATAPKAAAPVAPEPVVSQAVAPQAVSREPVAAEPLREAPRPPVVEPVVVAPVATASLTPVMSASVSVAQKASVAPQPVQQPEPAVSAPIPSVAAAAAPLPFDPSQIAEQDDRPSAIGSLNVPDLNIADAEPVVQNQNDDFDLESELGSIFSGAAAAEAAAMPAPAVAQAPVSAPPATDEFENFQRALEVDLRDSTPRPVHEPVATARVALDAGQSGAGRRRLLIGSVAAIAVLALGAGYFLFGSNSAGVLSSGEPPVIMADKDPIKVLPDNPGGTKVPNQDKAVYDRVAGQKTDPQQKTLISSNEEPVDVVQKTLLPESLPEDEEGALGSATPVGETEDPRLLPGMRPEDTAANASDDGDVTITPRKVRTMIVRSDGTLVAAEEPTQAPADSSAVADPAPSLAAPSDAGVAAASAQQDTLGTEVPASSPDAAGQTSADTATGADTAAPVPSLRPVRSPTAAPVETAQPQAAAPTRTAVATPAAATAPVAQTPVTSAPAATAPAPAGGYYIQIASLPSEAEAQKSYRNLAARYANVIGGKGVDIKRADISGKGTYYRVRIPAGDKNAAAAMCENYRTAGGSCLIAR